MNEKFDYYDLLSMLVPGTLLLGSIPFSFQRLRPLYRMSLFLRLSPL